jgi:protein-disulfide isomerase
MKRSLPFLIVIAVALLTIGGGVYFYRAKKGANLPLQISKMESSASAEVVHSVGPENAPVIVEEFGDFQCPPCGRLSEPLNEMQKKYNLRLIYRNFPLPNHSHAKEAAWAAEAAGRQGKFWPMHDLLFREQAVWSNSADARSLFQAYAGMLQLDLSRFRSDMESPDVQQKVDTDQRRGAAIGVKTTPTLFVNNEAVPPSELNPSKLPAFVENAVKNAKPSS